MDQSVKQPEIKRGKDGLFLPGTKGGPGNPFGGRALEIRRILFDNIKEKEWIDVRKALFNKALSGDVKALALLFSYTLGKPVQPLDLSVTSAQISPEDAQKRIMTFFGLAAPSPTPEKND
jgi:hypothetical protein